MKQARSIAFLAMAAAVGTTVLSGPAEAQTELVSATTMSAKTVRYAALGSCSKVDYSVPCGSWKLVLRNGKTVKLADAAVYSTTAGGKVDKENNAPLAVSGDGSRVVYFRRSDRRLVWRNATGGASHRLPGAAARTPAGLSTSDVTITVSPAGDRVILDYFDENEKLPTLLVDLTDGQIAKLPGADSVQGFSPDGRHVLMSRSTDDNTTEFAVYDTDGKQGESREVPQVVANNTPVALANDAVTVAVVIHPEKGRPRLRQYDLSTDAVSPAVDLGIPSGEDAYQIYWSNSNKLTLWHLKGLEDDTVARATASTVNPSTGGAKKIDSFMVKGNLWVWWLPGE